MSDKMTYTEAMFASKSPFDNPYQGKDKKVLFVCSAGILRSATAARIYARKYNTRAAGSSNYALIPVTHELLLWANEVVFVNEENYLHITRWFDLDNFSISIKVLNIPDEYEHMNPELIKHFEEQYEPIEKATEPSVDDLIRLNPKLAICVSILIEACKKNKSYDALAEWDNKRAI